MQMTPMGCHPASDLLLLSKPLNAEPALNRSSQADHAARILLHS
jgi:hypothetical protein